MGVYHLMLECRVDARVFPFQELGKVGVGFPSRVLADGSHIIIRDGLGIMRSVRDRIAR